MFFVLSVLVLIALVVIVLLAVYLVSLYNFAVGINDTLRWVAVWVSSSSEVEETNIRPTTWFRKSYCSSNIACYMCMRYHCPKVEVYG